MRSGTNFSQFLRISDLLFSYKNLHGKMEKEAFFVPLQGFFFCCADMLLCRPKQFVCK